MPLLMATSAFGLGEDVRVLLNGVTAPSLCHLFIYLEMKTLEEACYGCMLLKRGCEVH